jgi:hypothetical protein
MRLLPTAVLGILACVVAVVVHGWKTYMPGIAPSAFFELLKILQTIRIVMNEVFFFKAFSPPMSGPDALYPKGTRVIVSATTNPYRLKASLYDVLRIVAPIAHEIHLNVPDLYKNAEPYDQRAIEALKAALGPVLQVHTIGHDLGPASKIVPTLERLLASGHQRTYVLSIDDDTYLSPNDVVRIINDPASADAVTSGYIARQGSILTPYGVRGIVYGPGAIRKDTVDALKLYSGLRACKFHDDLAIGNALAACGVLVRRDEIAFYNTPASFSPEALFITQPSGLLIDKCNAEVAALSK